MHCILITSFLPWSLYYKTLKYMKFKSQCHLQMRNVTEINQACTKQEITSHGWLINKVYFVLVWTHLYCIVVRMRKTNVLIKLIKCLLAFTSSWHDHNRWNIYSQCLLVQSSLQIYNNNDHMAVKSSKAECFLVRIFTVP